MTPGPTVLVDATSLPANAGGVGRYLLNLLPALGATDIDLVIASQAKDASHWTEAVPSARVEVVPGWARSVPGRLLWEQIGLPGLARRVGASVIHCPHYTMPVIPGRPVVVTLHDATFFSHPDLHSRLKRVFFRFWTNWSARRATLVITPSQATLDEIRRVTHKNLSAAVVAYHGIDTARFRPGSPVSVEQATASFEGRGPYVAFVGTIEPRKNVVPLIRGFLRAIDDERLAGWRLLVAGGAGWDDDAVSLLGGGSLKPQVQWTGYLDDTTLPAFLAGAELVAYPSDGEGFGLPVLEAMACGSAVVTTDRLALPEVGGDVAYYTQPSADALAESLRMILLDRRGRHERSDRGVQRAAGFTWARSAKRHEHAYTEAVRNVL